MICEVESASIAFQIKKRYKGFWRINCESEKSLNFLKLNVLKMSNMNAKRNLYWILAAYGKSFEKKGFAIQTFIVKLTGVLWLSMKFKMTH